MGVVPDEIRAWKPETAPQAMVMNRKGKRAPEKTGPLPSMKGVMAGICTCGRTIRMPTARARMAPIFRKVDR
ncbi:hypothetical protein D3C86_2070430 [compost metagenome]